MENIDLILKNLTGKEEKKALEAARYMIDTSDVGLFQKLVDKSDYLFDFVRDNVIKRIKKSVNEKNFRNIVNFFEIYSPYYDGLFAEILSKYADEDFTDEMCDLLEKGTNQQKSYAAKYFCFIPDTIAAEILVKLAFFEDDNLSYNCAEALGQMQDDLSYNKALNLLQSSDDFDKLKAVKFFCGYGEKYPLREIFSAMKKSNMPENIAGQIPYMQSLTELLNSNDTKEDAILTINYIVSGLGEILPLSDIFQFELFELAECLVNTNKSDNFYSGKIAVVLLKMYSKFMLFTENQEYAFDETKETKKEINAVFNLLNNQGKEFWDLQKNYVRAALKQDKESIIAALDLVGEFSLTDLVADIKNILESCEDEIILYESLSALKKINSLSKDDVVNVSEKIHNPNIKAIIDALL